MILQDSLQYKLSILHLPPPLSTHRIAMMSPTENTLVSTCQTGRGFHASMPLNPIEGVLVTSSSPPEHGL